MIRARCILAFALLVPGSLAAQSPESLKEAVASITEADILRRIGVIAHDSMRGRNTPSPELEQTAAYIAGEFRKAGLKPGGDKNEYLQRYPLQRSGLDTAASMVAFSGGPTLRFGRDVIPGNGTRNAQVSGKIVILSGGRPEQSGLAGLNLAGAFVLILLSADDPLGRNHPLVQSVSAINAQQPAAMALVTPLTDDQWQATARAAMGARLQPGWRAGGTPPGGRVILAIRESSMRSMLEKKGVDFTALARSNSGTPKATAVDLAVSITLKPGGSGADSAPNVVGVLEGGDPVLKNEYIVFSAHMDHVGVAAPDARGDSIFNGADDDASGTIAVVELAEAYARLTPRPKRSMIFLTVSGEEKGLWGSEFFADHPTVPVSQIVANLNADMVGRNWKDTIVAIGKEHSDLGASLNRVNGAHPELRMTAIDDIWPEENFYRRSDHYNFAQKGVPILFFFNGTHPDYHGRDDEVEKIDGEKEARIAKLVFYLGLDIANAKDKPKWNPQSYQEIVRPTP